VLLPLAILSLERRTFPVLPKRPKKQRAVSRAPPRRRDAPHPAASEFAKLAPRSPRSADFPILINARRAPRASELQKQRGRERQSGGQRKRKIALRAMGRSFHTLLVAASGGNFDVGVAPEATIIRDSGCAKVFHASPIEVHFYRGRTADAPANFPTPLSLPLSLIFALLIARDRSRSAGTCQTILTTEFVTRREAELEADRSERETRNERIETGETVSANLENSESAWIRVSKYSRASGEFPANRCPPSRRRVKIRERSSLAAKRAASGRLTSDFVIP